jgi:hypothetical protein
MLTPEELEPTADDYLLADRLLADGWMQTSFKYRSLAKWKNPPPTIKDMVKDQYQGTWWGTRLSEREGFGSTFEMSLAPEYMVERRSLTVREFKAYRELMNRRKG